jgi:hypothetical protein
VLAQEHPHGLEDSLRITSDTLLATLEELHALESEKRSAAPGTAEFTELAQRIQQLTASALEYSRQQSMLAGDAEGGSGGQRTIEEVPPRSIHLVLADWRDAERILADLNANPHDRDLAHAAIRRLRDEYRRAHEAAAEADRA